MPMTTSRLAEGSQNWLRYMPPGYDRPDGEAAKTFAESCGSGEDVVDPFGREHAFTVRSRAAAGDHLAESGEVAQGGADGAVGDRSAPPVLADLGGVGGADLRPDVFAGDDGERLAGDRLGDPSEDVGLAAAVDEGRSVFAFAGQPGEEVLDPIRRGGRPGREIDRFEQGPDLRAVLEVFLGELDAPNACRAGRGSSLPRSRTRPGRARVW
jgi:hypothetical protein